MRQGCISGLAILIMTPYEKVKSYDPEQYTRIVAYCSLLEMKLKDKSAIEKFIMGEVAMLIDDDVWEIEMKGI
jgi:hypothetical protein